jgi:uncharacterized protein YkwD
MLVEAKRNVHGSRRRIAISIGAVSLTLVPFLLMPLAASATAEASAQCAKFVAPAPVIVGGVRTRIAAIAGCTAPAAIATSGASVTNLATLVSTTTWAAGKGTTIAKITYHGGPATSNCAKGTNLIVVGGTVTGGSGAALDAIRVGSTVSAYLCFTPTAAATLEPGSVWEFNAKPDAGAPTTTTTKVPTTTTTLPSGDSPPAPVPLPAGLSACPSSAPAAMITLVNRDRRQTGNLPPLAENANLDWAARKHAIVMASTSVMSHDGWDTEIGESHYKVGAPGWTGQNIAWMSGGYAPSTIESMFFNETPPNDGHRQNILSTSYHNIGVGCMVNNSTGAYWWAQDFGS